MNRNAKAMIRHILKTTARNAEDTSQYREQSITRVLCKGGEIRLPGGDDATFFNTLPCGHPDQKDKAKLDFWKDSGMVVYNGCQPDSCCHKLMRVTDCEKARAFVSGLTGIDMPPINANPRRQLQWVKGLQENHAVRCVAKDRG
jgi:hypothetical protein